MANAPPSPRPPADFRARLEEHRARLEELSKLDPLHRSSREAVRQFSDQVCDELLAEMQRTHDMLVSRLRLRASSPAILDDSR
jgi:hypothetical protein